MTEFHQSRSGGSGQEATLKRGQRWKIDSSDGKVGSPPTLGDIGIPYVCQWIPRVKPKVGPSNFSLLRSSTEAIVNWLRHMHCVALVPSPCRHHRSSSVQGVDRFPTEGPSSCRAGLQRRHRANGGRQYKAGAKAPCRMPVVLKVSRTVKHEDWAGLAIEVAWRTGSHWFPIPSKLARAWNRRHQTQALITPQSHPEDGIADMSF